MGKDTQNTESKELEAFKQGVADWVNRNKFTGFRERGGTTIDYTEQFSAIYATEIIDHLNTLPDPVGEGKDDNAAIKAEAIREAAKDIYLNDDIIEKLKVGGKKSPDNYRAEGWWQAYQWLQQRAQSLTPKANNEGDESEREEKA